MSRAENSRAPSAAATPVRRPLPRYVRRDLAHVIRIGHDIERDVTVQLPHGIKVHIWRKSFNSAPSKQDAGKAAGKQEVAGRGAQPDGAAGESKRQQMQRARAEQYGRAMHLLKKVVFRRWRAALGTGSAEAAESAQQPGEHDQPGGDAEMVVASETRVVAVEALEASEARVEQMRKAAAYWKSQHAEQRNQTQHEQSLVYALQQQVAQLQEGQRQTQEWMQMPQLECRAQEKKRAHESPAKPAEALAEAAATVDEATPPSPPPKPKKALRAVFEANPAAATCQDEVVASREALA